MTRNLKAFGLALVAMLAFAGIAAQGASAVVEHSFRLGANKTVLTGKNHSYTTGSSKDVFTATGGVTVECDGTYENTEEGTTKDTLTVHPKYHNCKAFGGNASVDTNGCNYVFDSDTTQANGHSTSSEHAAVSLECMAGHHILVTGPGCNLTFSANHSSVSVNQSLHGVRYTQLVSHSDPGGVSKHALTVKATVRTVHYTVLGGSLCGLVGHPAGTYSNGSLDGAGSLTAYTDSTPVSGSTTLGQVWSHGAQVDLTISTPT
jgi:hypothetical protein